VNVQDSTAIKNVWKANSAGKRDDVSTYGLIKHENDPTRILLKINFYADDMLGIGKSTIDTHLAEDEAQFVKAFKAVDLDTVPNASDKGGSIRWNRRVLAYRTLLYKAGFEPPSTLAKPTGRGLFGEKLIKAMKESTHPDRAADFIASAKFLENISGGQSTSWAQLESAFKGLHSFIHTAQSGWKDFNDDYTKTSSSGQSWADPDFLGLLGMIAQPNGSIRIRALADRHSPSVSQDYAVGILNDLHTGKLVVIDQSLGDEQLNQIVADRIIKHIFDAHQRLFSESKAPPQIMVYVEEAHNRLPKGSETDATMIWPRVAKEGAKLKIGMVYATQEVSSIQKNILKNTSNWFIGHLNNTDETKELARYYDFGDYEDSILRAQNPGFLRVKTRSNPYVIPVQIDRFVMPTE
jgi:hypothetical protein